MDKIVLYRDSEGMAQSNVPHKIVRHSPTGFEWGYGGSGPADLALNILLMVTEEGTANLLYQRYKAEVVAAIPEEGGEIEVDSVRKWVIDNLHLLDMDAHRL